MPDGGALGRLEGDGLLQRAGPAYRTTSRFQAALARAAYALQRRHAPWTDLRLPLAAALAERYPDLPEAALAELVEAMLAVEEAELAPLFGAPVAPPEHGPA
jgi:hypothetical protein